MLATEPAERWELYRLLSEPVRLQLLALAAVEELTIGELGDLLGFSQPKVSRHVAPLIRAGLLRMRRQGTRTLVRTADRAQADAVVSDALLAGRRLCEQSGILDRVASIVAARDAATREFFARPSSARDVSAIPSELPAYLHAVAALLPRKGLAVDVGTGDGGLLEVLAPMFDRVVGIDRSEAQLAAARARIERRGYSNVELLCGDPGDSAIRDRVIAHGQADVVFASRILHHAPKPTAAVSLLADLTKPGGAIVVLDYAQHDDEQMRERQADLWLGFSAAELESFADGAGLLSVRTAALPMSFGGEGPDAHLTWQLMTATKPDKCGKD